MSKRVIAILSALGLVSGLLAVVVPTAHAQEAPAPAIPEVANIEDPFGDANTLAGDQVTPVDGGSQTDIGKVWFTHDSDNLNVHFLTEGAPNANSLGFQFVVTAGEAGCLVIDGLFDGSTYTSENLGRVTDNCNDLDQLAEGTSFTFGPAPEGGGLATITVPRSYSPLFADGSVIVQPKATTWVFVGGQQVYDATQMYRGVRQRIDDTKVGTDYAVTGAGPVVQPDPRPEPPGKADPPGKGKKKGCGKGKGNKKGACPGGKPGKPGKPAGPAGKCSPFVPGEAGAEKPTVVVTDAATAEEPVEQEVSLDASVADADLLGLLLHPSSDVFNIQVDPAAKDTGLYVSIEFPTRRDYDLNLLHPDGSYAARSRGFNPVVGTPIEGNLSATGHGGEPTDHSETLGGIRTSDCGGWSLQVQNWLGEGGTMTVKMWLGDANYDPQEPGAETPS